MAANGDDLTAFVAVARARGFRAAGRALGVSPTTLGETVRRLEDRLGVRLLHRATRSVSPTEAGGRLVEQLAPLLTQVDAALASLNVLRDTLAGTLRLNVPVGVARLVLPDLLAEFLALYPDVHVEVVAEDTIIDVLAAGADAGICYDEKLEQDMIAVPIGLRVQRFAMAAHRSIWRRRERPNIPENCSTPMPARTVQQRIAAQPVGTRAWRRDVPDRAEGAAHREHQRRDGPSGGHGSRRCGHHRPVRAMAPTAYRRRPPRPVLPEWWSPFPGPFLYYSGRRLVPPPLRAFLDFVRSTQRQ